MSRACSPGSGSLFRAQTVWEAEGLYEEVWGTALRTGSTICAVKLPDYAPFTPRHFEAATEATARLAAPPDSQTQRAAGLEKQAAGGRQVVIMSGVAGNGVTR